METKSIRGVGKYRHGTYVLILARVDKVSWPHSRLESRYIGHPSTSRPYHGSLCFLYLTLLKTISDAKIAARTLAQK